MKSNSVQATRTALASVSPMVGGGWYKRLRESLKSNAKSRDSRYFQVATVDERGRPTNRTVVYRGFLPTPDGRVDENVLTFVTDRRSEKVRHLDRAPFAEVAWYFPVTREQYRISGRVQVVTEQTKDAMLEKARQMAWSNMSDPGRQQFLWPTPGEVRGGDDEAQYNTTQMPTKDDPVAPAFCLCCLEVDRVSLLSLRSNERWDFSRGERIDGMECDEEVWQTKRVNP